MRDVKNTLGKYESLLSIVLRAVQDLQIGKIPDPTIVGDSACQFRAGMMAEILGREHLAEEMSGVEMKLQSAIQRIGQLNWPELQKGKKNLSLREFLQEREWDVVIARRFQMLALASFLTRVQEALPLTCELGQDGNARVVSLRDRALPVDKQIAGISASYGKDLLSMAKIRLSQFSVQYIRGAARCLANPLLQRWVDEPYIGKTSGGLYVVPSFAGMEILFQRALLKNIPVVLQASRINIRTGEQVDQLCLFFMPNASRADFAVCNEPSGLQGSPAIVVEGICMAQPGANMAGLRESLSDYQKRLSEQSLMQIVLADGAVHSQYPTGLQGSAESKAAKSAMILQDPRRRAYEEVAEKQGFSPANSSCFRVYHIRCAIVGNMQGGI